MTNEELLAFIKKNPIGVGCGVLSVALGAAAYIRGGSLPDVEAELVQKTAEADKHAANITNAVQLPEHLEALVEANKEIESRIIRAGQLGVNNQYFFALERDTGTKLIDFAQLPLQPAKGPKTAFTPVGFKVSVQGTQAQLLDFLHRLESRAHYCRVLLATCGVSPAKRDGPLGRHGGRPSKNGADL
jgi:hypothetical protein